MCRTRNCVALDLAARDRSFHVLANGFYAIKLPIDSNDGNRTGQDFGGSGISLGQVLIATDFDLHNRNIVPSVISGISETCGHWDFALQEQAYGH
jgi:hypothetical protein